MDVNLDKTFEQWLPISGEGASTPGHDLPRQKQKSVAHNMPRQYANLVAQYLAIN